MDITTIQNNSFGDFEVEISDSVDIYLDTLKNVFDFDALSKLIKRNDFKLVLDSLNGGLQFFSFFYYYLYFRRYHFLLLVSFFFHFFTSDFLIKFIIKIFYFKPIFYYF